LVLFSLIVFSQEASPKMEDISMMASLKDI
jgi:hypothetical protein